jgi:A/G-specific adenine glycosylase
LPDHDDHWRDAKWRSGVRRALLSWFDRHARDLPWRQDPTPYRVWVSEIMLQQTQVATVIAYYHRFLQAFPTVQHLAEADPEHLLSLWEGLGYYRRARSMHAAAQRIMSQHGGVFPESFDEVIALPGIGRYTAGAILSIARDQKLPIVEGNTQRVFSRWIALRTPMSPSSGTKLLWQVAEAMLPKERSGAFNQAAMELGSLVCVPAQPDCEHCPVAKFCSAHSLGLQDVIPGRVSRMQYEDRAEYALIVRQSSSARKPDKYLMRNLPEGGRWAGLWDFPRTMDQHYDSVEDAVSGLEKQFGLSLCAGERLTLIRHAVTRFRIQLHVHEAQWQGPESSAKPPWRWLTLAQIDSLPMSVTARQITKLLRGRLG